MHAPLTPYFFPTTTLLIDDSQSFLDSLTFNLSQQIICTSYTDPTAALLALQKAYQHTVLQQLNLYQSDHDIQQHDTCCSTSINLSGIHRILFNSERFILPSVIVVDFSMPEMDGISLCKAIQHLPCKKILLTGHADEKIATQAFNHKLIDCYVKKQEISPDGLLATILAQQQAFFIEQSSILKNILPRSHYAFLFDIKFEWLLQQLYQQHHFVEHYLYPNPPGILLLDAAGKPSLLVVETESGLQSHYEIILDQQGPPALLTALKQRSIIPFFHTSHGVYQTKLADNWENYCLTAQSYESGENKYYWALFNLPASFFTLSFISLNQHLSI